MDGARQGALDSRQPHRPEPRQADGGGDDGRPCGAAGRRRVRSPGQHGPFRTGLAGGRDALRRGGLPREDRRNQPCHRRAEHGRRAVADRRPFASGPVRLGGRFQRRRALARGGRQNAGGLGGHEPQGEAALGRLRKG